MPVVHLRYPSLCHSFAGLTGLESCRRAVDEAINELAALFYHSNRPG